MKLNASIRLIADAENVIAPAESYKHENENELKNQQHEHQQDVKKGPEGEGEHNNQFTAEGASTCVDNDEDIPATESEYAINACTRILADRLNTESDPLTMDEENATTADADPKIFNVADQAMG
jgi:hypothetical protein